jgi:phage terminase large subunit-like protein
MLKLRPWQKRFIRAVYKTNKAGNRAVRTAVLSVGRKNGKTQLAAALCLCALSGPEAGTRRWTTFCPVAHRAITERQTSSNSRANRSRRKESGAATCTAIRSIQITIGTRHDLTPVTAIRPAL